MKEQESKKILENNEIKDMKRSVKSSQEQIEEIIDSSNINLSKEQREKMISDIQSGKKSPSDLIKNGDLESLQSLIDDGLDVNEPNEAGTSLIQKAIMYSDIEIIKLLLKSGVDLNILVDNILPLIVFASMNSDIDVVKLLIENGANIDVMINDRAPFVLYALTFGNTEVIKLLIDSGASLEFESLNTNLLEQALLFSNNEIIELCLEKGLKFSDHIILDVVNQKDEYLFDREIILPIIESKKEYRLHFNRAEEAINGTIQNQLSVIKYLKEIKSVVHKTNKDIKAFNKNEEVFNFNEVERFYKLEENQNTNIDKEFVKLEKLQKKSNKIRNDMTLMLNQLNDIQDKMTALTILDFLKIFIKYGGDANYKDENSSTALMYVAFFGHEDCVKLLIENGAEIDTINNNGETALFASYYNNHFSVVKLLIDSGADVNITIDNGESFYKKVKHDKNHEVLEWIENSPTYIKLTHDPKELVKLLSNFTIDKPIKYTTHSWDFGDLKKEYGNFDGYMSAVKNQFESMKSELEELSPNLYKKIYTFLIETTPYENYSWCSKTDINIGWSSLDGLKEHCDSGENPFSFRLPNPIYHDGEDLTTFEDIINLFKQEIEIRENFKNLKKIFDTQEEKLSTGRKSIFKLDISTAKLGRQFYTDTQKFSSVLDKIFADMGTRKEYPNITVTTTELEDRSIELKITQLDSNSSRSADELLDRAKVAGDIKEIKESLTNLCDWSVESCYDEQSFRVNFLHSNNVKEIVPLESKADGFTHILRFYK